MAIYNVTNKKGNSIGFTQSMIEAHSTIEGYNEALVDFYIALLEAGFRDDKIKAIKDSLTINDTFSVIHELGGNK